jgi:hypothetical protein
LKVPIKGLLELHEDENPEMTSCCVVDDQKRQLKVSMLLYHKQLAVAVPILFVLKNLAVCSLVKQLQQTWSIA